MPKVLSILRTYAFYGLWFLPYTVFWCGLSSATFWLVPRAWRYDYLATCWAVPLLWGARLILGIDYEVVGKENIPPRAVVLCNHQSTWEALMMLATFRPQIPVLKESLLKIPFFGWAARSVRAVAINRDDPRGAAKKVMAEGKRHLQEGVSYLVFYPEGTRNAPGELGKFSRGGGVLAKQVGLPLVPVSQDSGHYWRHGTLAFRPGKVRVEIHPPIDTADQSVAEAVAEARAVIAEALARKPSAKHGTTTSDPQIGQSCCSAGHQSR